MKLNEVMKRPAKVQYWKDRIHNGYIDDTTDDEMLAAIDVDSSLIVDLIDVGYEISEEVRWVALRKWPWAIEYYYDVSDEMKVFALSSVAIVEWATKREYDKLVNELYPTNELMRRKWKRYGDHHR